MELAAWELTNVKITNLLQVTKNIKWVSQQRSKTGDGNLKPKQPRW